MADRLDENDKDALLIEADSLCSLIYHRERHRLDDRTVRDLDVLVRKLRPVTDRITRERREVSDA